MCGAGENCLPVSLKRVIVDYTYSRSLEIAFQGDKYQYEEIHVFAVQNNNHSYRGSVLETSSLYDFQETPMT